jgi:hypothetical protein
MTRFDGRLGLRFVFIKQEHTKGQMVHPANLFLSFLLSDVTIDRAETRA